MEMMMEVMAAMEMVMEVKIEPPEGNRVGK